MDPIILPPLKWYPSPNFNSRRGKEIGLFILHESAGSYRSMIYWFQNPASRVSSHLGLNEKATECSQFVKIADRAWTSGAEHQARDFNSYSINLELANVTPKGYVDEHQLRVAARIAGFYHFQHDIPVRWARGGFGEGYTFHGDTKGTDHPNCGPDMAGWLRFLNMVEHEVARGGYRKTWSR